MDFLKFTTPVPIEDGAGLFLYEHSLKYFTRLQFILPAQDLDVVQIWLVSCLLVMFCHCREVVGNFCSGSLIIPPSSNTADALSSYQYAILLLNFGRSITFIR